jgi:thiosulfate reductase cytochrome b subunit
MLRQVFGSLSVSTLFGFVVAFVRFATSASGHPDHPAFLLAILLWFGLAAFELGRLWDDVVPWLFSARRDERS